MSASRTRSALIAIDTNVLLDLADEVDDVVDAVETIRTRLAPQILMPPTVREELAQEALHAEESEHR